jgi:hypothetical protein
MMPEEAEVDGQVSSATDILFEVVPELDSAVNGAQAEAEDVAEAEEIAAANPEAEVVSMSEAQVYLKKARDFLMAHPDHFSAEQVLAVSKMLDQLGAVRFAKQGQTSITRYFTPVKPGAAATAASSSAGTTPAGAAAGAAADATMPQTAVDAAAVVIIVDGDDEEMGDQMVASDV